MAALGELDREGAHLNRHIKCDQTGSSREGEERRRTESPTNLSVTGSLGSLGRIWARGAHHVAEATGLGPRSDLSGDEDDVLRF